MAASTRNRALMEAAAPQPPRVMPPHYFLFALVGMVTASIFDPTLGLLGSPWRWLGALPVFAGLMIALVASRQFSAAGTEIRPLHPSTALVMDGMFRFSRNPMYVSMIAALVGVALLLDCVIPWLVIPPFAALLYFRFVRHEEALMARTFGAGYLDYKTRVGRWL